MNQARELAMKTKKPVKRVTSPNHWTKLAAATLDALRANVFIADRDLKIIYINDCAKQTLQEISGEIRGVFNIEADRILGLSIHAFHRNPAAVEKILRDPQALPHQTEFAFGAVTLQARINSLVGPKGEVQGYVVAWEDITYRQRLELDYAGQVNAIHRSQAVIEFDMDGTITHANDNFLKAVGYTLDEIKGQRHSMFVDETTRSSAEYHDMWQRLNRGEFVAGEFRRVGKGGRELYIQGIYNAIVDKQGRPFIDPCSAKYLTH